MKKNKVKVYKKKDGIVKTIITNNDEDTINYKLSNTEELINKAQDEVTFNLDCLIEYYHKSLFNSKDTIDYLNNKGIKNQEIYARFKIGYSDGMLQNLLSKKQIKELQKINIIDNEGKETLFDNIIIPVFDLDNNVVDIYGINSANDSIKSIFNTDAIFNIKATKVYDEIIITDSIIDCLSLIGNGIENVIAIKNKGYIIEENIKLLKSNRVKTIIINFNDNKLLKELLIYEGFKVKSFKQPETVDINKEEIKSLIDDAGILESENNNMDNFSVTKDDYKYIFRIRNIIYTITGVKEVFVSNLRVSIRAELNGEWFPDNIDLYSARSRTSFSLSISKKFNIEEKRIENDLLRILDYFENERDRILKSNNEDDENEILTEEEREIGLEFLKSKDIFKQIVDDMSILGYVGEDLNKQLLYLCASSRKLDDPISVLIISQSASGKSFLVDTVKKLIPSNDVVSIITLSDQALNYIPDLLYKFIVFGEAIHSEAIYYQIREMLSSKELTRLVAVKDDKTGKIVSKLIRKKVIVSSVMSTTNHKINPENASRYFLINADESKEQTKRIHEVQKLKYTLERQHIKDKVIPEIIKKHNLAQKLLKKVVIVNDFAKYLDFPSATMRTRRDHERFINLIASVCFLRQYQKEIKRSENIEYIECDLEDYKVAYNIMIKGVLSSTMIELPRGALNLYEEIRKMVKRVGKERDLLTEEVTFIQRELREYSRFNADSIKKYLKILVDFEYIVVSSGKNRGTRYSYKLRKDEPIESIDISVIPSPEYMEELINKEESKPVLKN